MIATALCISWLYWLFLLPRTAMVVIYDGETFRSIAQLIYEHGWLAYFQTGPHNEPIYPALIAAAMKLAEYLPFSYEKILAFIQINILFLTQRLTLRLLKKCGIPNLICAAVLLYMGLSPCLVNAALSHWSEITAIPFVVALILLACRAWELKDTGDKKSIALTGVSFALVCIGLVCTKAIFEFVFVIFFLPFIMAGILAMRRNDKQFKNIVVFAVTALSIFYGFIYTYKSVNRHFNGHFMMADRGPYIMYGNVIKRTDHPLSAKSWAASLAFIPGDGVCKKIFGDQECAYWQLQQVDHFGQGKLAELRRQGMAGSSLDKTLLDLSKTAIITHPFQYGTLTALEGLKIFFWESTLVGFVRYPPVLTQLFNCVLLKNSLRLVMAAVTMLAFGFCLWYLLKNKMQTPASAPLLFMLSFIVPFTAFYAFFFIHTRYTFPIVPLYLTMIAFWLQNTFKQT